ncbi:MAG: hypothetical protein ACI97B_004282, partial [Verrucomicrobiales bacterium]
MKTLLTLLSPLLFLLLFLLLSIGQVHAQRGRYVDPRYDRNGVPRWDDKGEFNKDVFTFVRIQYSSYDYRGGKWATDYPDSDLNFSYRLQQLTSMEVDPDGKVMQLTDKALVDYPFIYLIEPGDLEFEDAEVIALRKYLLNGGFLMVDDFWGDEEWDNLEREMKRVFPKREIVDLTIDHPIFHCVFDLKALPQVPALQVALEGRPYGVTWERGEEGRTPHYRAIFDDKGRMMTIICHNTDLGDGWEREGENHWYFKEFSEKLAFPMGI